MSAGERFLDSFAAIERMLRLKAGARKDEPFYGLIALASRSDASVRRMASDLKEFADLRNAIVHERGGGYLIAEPHERAVRRLEDIRRLLERPPQVGSMFRGPIRVASPADAVGAVAKLMRAGDFSQVPIYDGSTFAGLLTAETVMRWLAAMLADDVGLVEEAPVADVLLHTEDPDHHCEFLARTATSFDALDAFVHYSTQGWSLDAIMVTDSGEANQQPLGIITTFDIPTLLTASGGRSSGIA